MFKKPTQDLKTSAPLRNSDRKKFRQRVLQQFSIASKVEAAAEANIETKGEKEPDIGDILVPDGILSVKFRSHLDEPGVIYLSPNVPYDPLFFTFGHSNKDEVIIPTVYTLWKVPHLIPTLSTPRAVIPKLSGGADLMAPGVVTCPQDLNTSQIVSISAYIPAQSTSTSTASDTSPSSSSSVPRLSYPLAVGTMAIPSSSLKDDTKGKVVHLLHAYGDHLWSMGGKTEPPADGVPFRHTDDEGGDGEQGEEVVDQGKSGENDQRNEPPRTPSPSPTPIPSQPDLSPQEVSAILRTSTLQALSTSLAALPKSSFPLSASQLYTTHILPSRPAFIPSPSNAAPATTPVDIKHSSFKSLTAFLKSLEKEGLIKTKDIRSEVHLTSFDATHTALAGHQTYKTIGDVEKKAAQKEAREKEDVGKMKSGAIEVVESWRPQGANVKFFEECKLSPSKSYTQPEIRSALQSYIAANKDTLVDPRKQHLIKLDPILASIVLAKDEWIDDMKREDILERLIGSMQPFYSIKFPGEEAGNPKKGTPPSIKIEIKMRQGRKACTLITGLESWKIDPASLADELRVRCASSTSVSDLPGKNAGKEVLVQGKQTKLVVEMIETKGISKKWIKIVD
ncbi:hypothetical protein SISSUDRAFT_1070619 [Sistotremastrum suecicum HHB10207 ss-3]|uniref:SUI1 domain-containing protein n=1 Tax=Sistotremastrum suecicum HHB10207 ss-3 TaxID=1314776 RepID=A0A166E4M4_9AGAM|nr:hypothetical protein SISSUDRAFT_1070619 [Sistotremastrum suecicum HHB10207 ss-3]